MRSTKAERLEKEHLCSSPRPQPLSPLSDMLSSPVPAMRHGTECHDSTAELKAAYDMGALGVRDMWAMIGALAEVDSLTLSIVMTRVSGSDCSGYA